MEISDRYTWEAEKANGKIITEGGDLTDCVRFSLMPAEGTGLPQHDLIGVKMIRRFARGFIKVNAGGLKEYVHCVVCKGFRVWIKSTDGTVLITPEDHELRL